jgi:hypothetical protein
MENLRSEENVKGEALRRVPPVKPSISSVVIDGEFRDVLVYREVIDDNTSRYTSVSDAGKVLNIVKANRRSVWTDEVIEAGRLLIEERMRQAAEAEAPAQPQ